MIISNETDIESISEISEQMLIDICTQGFDQLLKSILLKFDLPKEQKNILLIRAAALGHLNCINHLIRNGADVSFQNNAAIVLEANLICLE